MKAKGGRDDAREVASGQLNRSVLWDRPPAFARSASVH